MFRVLIQSSFLPHRFLSKKGSIFIPVTALHSLYFAYCHVFSVCIRTTVSDLYNCPIHAFRSHHMKLSKPEINSR